MDEDKYKPVKFRYTFESVWTDKAYDDEFVEAAKYLTSLFINAIDPLYVTCGIEELNKMGEKTHLHIHIHAYTPVKVGTIRARIKKIFVEMGETRSGDALYGIAEVKDELERNRILRYPFKQSRRGLGSISWTQALDKYPADFDYFLERELAVEEWERLVLVHRKKLEKSLKPNTFEKFEEYMLDKTVNSLMDIALHIDKFYLDEGMSMNRKTMAGYVVTFARKKGLISAQENAAAILQCI